MMDDDETTGTDTADAVIYQLGMMALTSGIDKMKTEEDNLVIASDDDDNEELDEDEDDDDGRRRNKKKSVASARSRSKSGRGKGRGRGASRDRGRGRGAGRGRGRGRGRPRNTEADDDLYFDYDNELLGEEYKKKEKEEWEACPPPAPTKMKGGRKTLLKMAFENDVPELEVQKICAALKRKSLFDDEDYTYNRSLPPVQPFKGFGMSLMVQQMSKCAQQRNSRASLMEKGIELSREGGIGKMVLTMQAHKTSWTSFTDLLEAEHLCFTANCHRHSRLMDSKKWLVELAHSIHTSDGTYPYPPFAMHVGKAMDSNGGNENESEYVTPNKMDSLLKTARSRLIARLGLLSEYAIQTARIMQSSKLLMTEFGKKKYRMEMDLTRLYDELSNIEPKFDETSVSGIRHVKLAMEAPYIKTENAFASFHLPLDVVQKLNYTLPFRVDKQKWTTKDLHALKKTIREHVINRAADKLDVRYFELLWESEITRIEEMEAEGLSQDEIFQPPVKRKRGRPTREETMQKNLYGVIRPIVFQKKIPPSENSSGGMMTARYEVQPKRLSDWRKGAERRLRGMGFEHLMCEAGEIDWSDIASKLMMRTRKFRLPQDCKLAFNHEVSSQVLTKRWSGEESKLLTELQKTFGNDWEKITEKINENHILAFSKSTAAIKNPNLLPRIRTSYQTFFRFRNKISPPAKPEWTPEMDDKVRKSLSMDNSAAGHVQWRRIAAVLDDEAITKKIVVERYKKAIVPVLRVGAFTRVEDCLLLLTMEKLKPFLEIEGHFGCLLPYLPWRYETTWRDRANNLFNDWIVPWTIEEDRLLIKLAVDMNRNWQKISEQFTSFKNRKGCLTRYKILMKKIEGPNAVFKDLEEYHDAYSMTRYNIFQYRHLKECLIRLHKTKKTNLDLKQFPFVGLDRDKPPSNKRLRHMLLAFDKEILNETIKSLEKYVKSRDQYWINWLKKFGERKKTFDRRTFNPENPKSVASAIHIRSLKLKPKENFTDLNDFEDEIYLYYGRFCKTKKLKPGIPRPYLPPAKHFINWSKTKRIIATKLKDVVENEKDRFNTKWLKKYKKLKPWLKKNNKQKQKKRKAKVVESSSEEDFDFEDGEDEEYAPPQKKPKRKRTKKTKPLPLMKRRRKNESAGD